MVVGSPLIVASSEVRIDLFFFLGEHSLGRPHPLGKLPSISSAQPARHTEGFFRTNTHMSGQMTTHLNRIVSGDSLLQRGPAQRQCIHSKEHVESPSSAASRSLR